MIDIHVAQSGARALSLRASALLILIVAVTLAGCGEEVSRAPEPRPVRAVIVQHHAEGEPVSLTGQIHAEDQTDLAFRIDGRMIERRVNVGDVLAAGEVIARLDEQNQQNMLRSAEANLSSAEAARVKARLTFKRQQALRTTEAQVDSAQAQLRIAQDQLSYTVLLADGPGTVTAVGAEAGEVVSAGQMVVQLARQGGLDAVFDVPEQLIRTGPRDPAVEIALANDAEVRATGRVREVAPQADSETRTFQVKVGIIDPPEGMRLGATVTGRIKLSAPPGVEVPASALTEAEGRPAVWVVDPQSETVSLRHVDVVRYDPASVVISKGLETGEIVVIAGVQSLRPGQSVRLLEAGS